MSECLLKDIPVGSEFGKEAMVERQRPGKSTDLIERKKAEIRAYMTAIRDELRNPPMDEIPRNH